MSSLPKSIYAGITGRKKGFLLLGALLLVLLFVLDLGCGPAGLSPGAILRAIFRPCDSDDRTHTIVWVMRTPIASMALVVGASLAVAGVSLQTILDNTLASPYTLGISAASSFGAALAIVAGSSVLPVSAVFMVPMNAFLFAMAAALMIYLVARMKQGSAQTIVLIGVLFSFLFNSLLSFVQYMAKDNEGQAIVFWLFGSLQGATWLKVGIVGAVLLISLPLLLMDSWKLTALRMGDEKAKSMGVNTKWLRLKVILLVSMLTAVSVSFVGAIGFVGLVAPHVARSFAGEDHRFLLPSAGLCGAIMLSFASIVSKTIIPGAIYPVGITTSFIGVPFLMYIIFKKK